MRYTFGTIFVYLLLIVMMSKAVSNSPEPLKEDKKRTAVKILMDEESKRINWQPEKTTVSFLQKLKQENFPKEKDFNKNQRWGYEFNTYEIDCFIKKHEQETNGDIRLLLMDTKDTTQVIDAVIINPLNDSLDESPYINSFMESRYDFGSILKNNKTEPGLYHIIGVCFFENKTAELHPVMNFEKKSNY